MKRSCIYILMCLFALPVLAQDLDLIYFRYDYSMDSQLAISKIESIKREANGQVILLVGIADSLYLFDEAKWHQVNEFVSEAPSSTEFNAYKELSRLSSVLDEHVSIAYITDEEGYQRITSSKGVQNLNVRCIVGDRYIESEYIKGLWTRFFVANELNKRGDIAVSFILYPCGASYGNDEYLDRSKFQYNKIYTFDIDTVSIEK